MFELYFILYAMIGFILLMITLLISKDDATFLNYDIQEIGFFGMILVSCVSILLLPVSCIISGILEISKSIEKYKKSNKNPK